MPARLTSHTILPAFLIFLAALLRPLLADAEPAWPVPTVTPVANNAGPVVDIQNAGDGSNRIFLVGQDGHIRILKDGILQPTPFLDVSTKTSSPHGEQGLLGMAFPPGFSQKKCFYVFYCRKSDGATVVSRFRMSAQPDQADPASEEILLVTSKSQSNHNGGQLAFGPDGFLYISIGDGGGSGDPQRNSQKLNNRLGKILRIDVENTSPDLPYAIPATNPFATSSSRSREILCWGLRNPWRFSFDPMTGDLFIGDVGEQQREEINFLPAASINAGANFGWSVKEGTLDFAAQTIEEGALLPPAFEYDRSLGTSVTGGYIYRGSDPRLQGFYIFGDYSTGRIWAMESPTAGGRVILIKDTSSHISTFGRDEAGEIYFGDQYLGTVHRIGTTDTLPPPEIYPPAGILTHGVEFRISSDTPGGIIRYTMDGTVPDQSSPVFTPGGWLQKYDPFTLKAAVFRPDLTTSAVVVADYGLRPSQVEIGGGNGNHSDYTNVQLTSPTPGTEIRFTLDNTEPTSSSTLYSPATGIDVRRSLYLKATAFRQGTGWHPGVPSVKYFRLNVADPAFVDYWPDINDPVHVTSDTPGAVLHYTLDGSTPTLQSPVWTGPRQVPPGTEINVLATKGQMTPSTNRMKVTAVSAQKTRFERMGSGYLMGVSDVVKVNSDFYATGMYQIWKLQNDTWSIYRTGGFAQSFVAAAAAPGGKLAVADTGIQAIIQLLPPASTELSRWSTSGASPRDLLPLSNGSFVIADFSGNRIKNVSSTGVTSLAGTGAAGSADGPVAQATFHGPAGLATDAANRIYVAESWGMKIRVIGQDNIVSTLAGTGASGWTDGPASSATFEKPVALVRDRIGNLYVSDNGPEGKIRKIRPDGTVTTLRGPTYQAGTSTLAHYGSFGPLGPSGLEVDSNGVLYIAGDSSITRAVQEDWDNDGIPDSTETTLGTPFMVGTDDRYADQDGDLLSNHAEWVAGTNPKVTTTSKPTALLNRKPDGTIALQFPCEPGKRQHLEYSDDLLTWRPMGISSVSSYKSFSATFPAPANTTGRFYRLKSTPD